MPQTHLRAVLAVTLMLGTTGIAEAATIINSQHRSVDAFAMVGGISSSDMKESFGPGLFDETVMVELSVIGPGGPTDIGSANANASQTSTINTSGVTASGSAGGSANNNLTFAGVDRVGILLDVEFSVNTSTPYTLSGLLTSDDFESGFVLSLDRIDGAGENLFLAITGVDQVFGAGLLPTTLDLTGSNQIEGTLEPGTYKFFLSGLASPGTAGGINGIDYDITLALPEPGTAIMLLAAAPLIGLRRRT